MVSAFVVLAAKTCMMLLGLLSVTGPVLEIRRLGIASEPNAPWLMLPLLISDSTLLPVRLVIGAAIEMLPFAGAPICTTPAVMRLSSVWVRPSTPGAFNAPRLICLPAANGAKSTRAVPALTALLMIIASAASVIPPLLDWTAVEPVLSRVSVRCPGPACRKMAPPATLLVISGPLGELPGEFSMVKLPPAARLMLPDVEFVTKAFRVMLPPATAVIPAAPKTEPSPTPSPRLMSWPTVKLTLLVLLVIPAPDPVLRSAVAPLAVMLTAPVAVMPPVVSLIVPLLVRVMAPPAALVACKALMLSVTGVATPLAMLMLPAPPRPANTESVLACVRKARVVPMPLLTDRDRVAKAASGLLAFGLPPLIVLPVPRLMTASDCNPAAGSGLSRTTEWPLLPPSIVTVAWLAKMVVSVAVATWVV